VDLAEFEYDLPPEAIAQHPAAIRDAARLLLVDRHGQRLADHLFTDLPDLLRPGDCLVVNDSRVIPARILARDVSGGHVELLFLAPADVPGGRQRWRALVRPGRRCRVGASLEAGESAPEAGESAPARLTIVALGEAGERLVEREDGTIDDLLLRQGLPPLPPYIEHHASSTPFDRERYQTVYARQDGSVAAPTAGLHFTEELLERLCRRGVEISALTLHVGPATFRPIRTERVEAHRLPAERAIIPPGVAEAVNRARAERRRVVAVGTTATRALEGSVGDDGRVAPGHHEVDLFIVPGHPFRVIDALVTNFHLPRSSLLVLVSAFAGHELILKAYRHAIDAGYRFYSYGDACLIV
jgi:S-adenosylmethionine:tRNA ribosyltransferase-isomerase